MLSFPEPFFSTFTFTFSALRGAEYFSVKNELKGSPIRCTRRVVPQLSVGRVSQIRGNGVSACLSHSARAVRNALCGTRRAHTPHTP